MSQTPKLEAIFQAILPFLAEHQTRILEEMPEGATYAAFLSRVCNNLEHPVPETWPEVRHLITKIKIAA